MTLGLIQWILTTEQKHSVCVGYTPSNELARLYKKIVGAGDEFAIPKKVKISAYSTHIDVTVDYNPEDIPKDAPIAKE